jgi:ferredoxin-NADP reductase
MTPLLAPNRRPLPPRRLGTPPRRQPAPGDRGRSPGTPNATIAWREDLTATVARFGIRPDGGLPAFEPGQYLTVGLLVDGRLVQRPYSVASSAGDEAIELLIRLVPGGLLTPRLWQHGVGDRVTLGRPKGLFRLEPDDARPHLLLSTGTGIAPLVAMASALRDRDRDVGRVVLVHGVRDASELAYRDRLEQWQRDDDRIRYVPVVSGPAPGWRGQRGRIPSVLGSIVESAGAEPASSVAYVCGSPGMIDDVTAALRELGLDPPAVRSERYWTPAAGSA